MIETASEAERAYVEAWEHKRLSAHHRRMAARRMAEVRSFCERAGIAFELITRKDGDTSHGPGRDTQRN